MFCPGINSLLFSIEFFFFSIGVAVVALGITGLLCLLLHFVLNGYMLYFTALNMYNNVLCSELEAHVTPECNLAAFHDAQFSFR